MSINKKFSNKYSIREFSIRSSFIKMKKYREVIYTKYDLYRHYGIYINENCAIHYNDKIFY